jgi:uncharacterized protein YeeX (DUF496 family)
MPIKNGVSKVKKNGTVYWRARLTFPFDFELGYKPRPKDFYGKTAREAELKRANHRNRASMKANEQVSFLSHLRVSFIPYEEARCKNGDLSWNRLCDRKSRLKRFLIEPKDEKIAATRIRKTALSKLRPLHVEEFMRTLEMQEVSAYIRDGLYIDLRLALSNARRDIPERVDDYFAEIRRPTIRRKKPKIYDDQTIWDAIENPAFPLEDRLFVAFPFIMQCRPSEMFALTWSDIQDGQITFQKATRKVQGGYAITEGTKTGDKGIRTLPLGETLTQMLREVQKARMASGKATDWVFHHNRRSLNKDRLRYRWRQVKKSLGLPDGPTFYSLKKSGNSYAASSGNRRRNPRKDHGPHNPAHGARGLS